MQNALDRLRNSGQIEVVAETEAWEGKMRPSYERYEESGSLMGHDPLSLFQRVLLCEEQVGGGWQRK